MTTYSTERDGGACCSTCATSSRRWPRRSEPMQGRPDRWARRDRHRHGRAGRQGPRGDGGRDGRRDADEDGDGTIAALPSPPRGYTAAPPPAWDDLDVDPADLVVIVGGAELGPYGSSRTRFEMEVDDELSAAGVLELAWTTGLIKWEDDPKPGWYDTESGDLVDEAEIVERYHDAVVERMRHPRVRRRRRDRPPITRHRCWCRCSSTRTSPSWCRREADARAFVAVRPGAHRRHPGAGQRRLAGDPQGGHRDPGAAQDQAVAHRRRSDPDRVRPDGVGHQRGHGRRRWTGWRCGTSSRPSTRSSARASPRPS